MALKPEISIPIALTTGAVVIAVHQMAAPSIADVRTIDPSNRDVNAAERQATWFSLGIVGGISLITKDINVFIIGGTIAVVSAWWKRYSNAFNPGTGMAATVGRGRDNPTMGTPRVVQSEAPQLYSVPASGADSGGYDMVL
jgi:hypothetical protein